MKKLFCIVVVMLNFVFAFSQKTSSAKPLKDQSVQQSTSQDTLMLQKLANEYADSVLKKTSMVEFLEWVQANATVKEYRSVLFVNAYDSFISAKISEWLAKRKPVIQNTSPKN